jgi:RHS repeat-associated protein
MNNDDSLNVTAPTLPKGGGAIRSIGDGLGAVGARGAASYALPLPISPGRGFAPDLALSYSSDAGNSDFGMGWSKTVNAISRRTSQGVPTYTDEDSFLGPDGEVLMPERDDREGQLVQRTETHYRGLDVGSHQVTRYWPRIEGAFALIERWTSNADQTMFWLVHTADGGLHMYGKTADSRLACPDDETHVAAWLIHETVDPHGQHLAYEYKRDTDPPGPDQPRDGRAQRYLSTVYYGNAQGHRHLYAWKVAGWANVPWHFHLVFDYGERSCGIEAVPAYAGTEHWTARTDAYSDYRYGFELRTQRLCHQVLMFHNFAELGPEPVLVHRLLLEYRTTALGYSHLSAAHSQACDGNGVLHSRPPIEFTYQAFSPVEDVAGYQPFDAMPGLNDGDRYHLFDLRGEGMAGILYCSDKSWYYRAPKRAEVPTHPDEVIYDEWRELERIPVADSTKPVQQFLADLTGDGTPDWIIANPGWSGFFTYQPDGRWHQFISLKALPNEFFHPQAQLADLMGAGLQDLAMIGPRSVRFYASGRAEGYRAAQEVAHSIDEDRLPLFSRANDRLVAFCDVLGSGQQHLIEVRHDQLKCWPNLGRGRFGKGFVWCKLPFTYDEFDASRVLLADFDGSGTVDLVFLRPDCALIYMNRGGNGFDEVPLRLPWPPGVNYDRFCQVSAADLQGQGYSSLVLTVPHMSPRHWRYDLVHAKPYLLCGTNNNLGAAATVVYRSSAQEWLDEKKYLQARDQPAVCHLPFALPLVSVQIQHDEITGNQLTQRFSYRKAFYDGVEREFRGFALQLSSDCEEQAHGQREEGYSAPVLRKTWFHVGRVLNPPTQDYFDGDSNAIDLKGTLYSYYHEADDCDQLVIPDAKEQAQLCNALVGQVLRNELFDFGDEDGTPYSVEQHRYLLRRLQRPTGGKHAPYHVLHVLPVEIITYRYERESTDPVCQKTLNLQWDAFGNPTNSVTVHYARRLTALSDPACQSDPHMLAPQKRWWCDAHDDAQQRYYLTQTRAQFIHLTQPDAWRLGLPYVQRTDAMVLVKGAGPKGLMPQDITYEYFTSDSADNPLNDSIQRQLVGQSLQRYRKLPGNTPWPDGQAGFEALPDYVETAELDQPALRAYDLLKNEHGDMPFDLEARLTEIGYRRMPWLLGPQLEPELLWSIRRGFYTYAPLSGFHQVLTVRQTQAHGVTLLGYDPHQCLNTSVTLPDGCKTQVEKIDYRLMQPARILDPNQNSQEVLHDAFGEVLATSFYGVERGEAVGFDPVDDYQRPQDDSPAHAIEAPEQALQGAATAYFENRFSWMGRIPEVDRLDLVWFNECVKQGDLLPSGHIRAGAHAFLPTQDLTPARQRLRALLVNVRREPVHGVLLQADNYPTAPDRQIRMTIRYWDGFGRPLQTKHKVDDGYAYQVQSDGTLALDSESKPITLPDVPRWRVSERVEYNNKGLTVRVYRPYFASDWHCINDASFSQHGDYDTQRYDPLGRLTNTILAKEGYLRRQTYHCWHTTHEDENDTYEEVRAARAQAGVTPSFNPKVHTQTPDLTVIEPRGLACRAVAYCRSDPQGAADLRVTRTLYNKAGLAVAQWDPRLHLLHEGDPTVPANLATAYSLGGQVLSTQSVDAGWRVHVFGEAGQNVYSQDGRGTQREVEFDELIRLLAVFEQGLCTERFTYARAEPVHADSNLCGQVIRQDDTAGTRHFNEYAMGGTVLDHVQHFLKTLDMPDWPEPLHLRDALLEPGEGLRTQVYLDALGGVLQQIDVAGNHQGSRYTVDGQLREAWLRLKGASAQTTLVSAIVYDAHGKIERKTLGNGVVRQFDYCPLDGRLRQLSSYRGSGALLQDLHYEYEPGGNIVSIEDTTLAVRFFNNQRVDPTSRCYYDSIGQLVEATGFEAGSLRQGPNHVVDPHAIANFHQKYRYDRAGNLLELIHHGPQSHGRILKAAPFSNRCLPESKGGPLTPADFDDKFDPNGNLRSLGGRPLNWDLRNQLLSVEPVMRESTDNDSERYAYDANGTRRRKVRIAHTRARAVTTETRYLPGLEIRNVHGNVLHVITVGEVQVLHWETARPKRVANDQYRYNLDSHLGSWLVELDAIAKVVSHESYHPYGTTALRKRGDSSEKSYRTLGYSGKEKDATGLYYYGFRYYIPHFQRWLNPDSFSLVDGLNLYAMVRNNPVSLHDSNGAESTRDNFDEKDIEGFSSVFSSIKSGLMAQGLDPKQTLYLIVGRSPQVLGSYIEHMGYTTALLQLSGMSASRANIADASTLDEQQRINRREFIKSAMDGKDAGMQSIVMIDFSVTGNSISRAHKLVSEYYKEMNSDKVVKMAIVSRFTDAPDKSPEEIEILHGADNVLFNAEAGAGYLRMQERGVMRYMKIQMAEVDKGLSYTDKFHYKQMDLGGKAEIDLDRKAKLDSMMGGALEKFPDVSPKDAKNKKNKRFILAGSGGGVSAYINTYNRKNQGRLSRWYFWG